MDDTKIREFQQIVWDYYHAHGRHDLSWRQPETDGEFDPYKIMVSEIMLQQTQVSRVIGKYPEFLQTFPTIETLAVAVLGDVLRVWSGLGYNRRAKFLHQAAQRVGTDFPETVDSLKVLPGIGDNTAGAIMAYAYNKPVLFIETNVRTVYIHHFFNDQENVDDKDILNMLSITLNRENPRDWYWALMDYGSFLKRSGVRRNHQSKHYTKQSAFKGSKRQIRGEVLRQLSRQKQTREQLLVRIDDDRLPSIIDDLLAEGLIHEHQSKLRL